MNDEETIQPQESSMGNDSAPEGDVSSERVFDITEDLTIKPVHDEPVESASVSIHSQKTFTPPTISKNVLENTSPSTPVKPPVMETPAIVHKTVPPPVNLPTEKAPEPKLQPTTPVTPAKSPEISPQPKPVDIAPVAKPAEMVPPTASSMSAPQKSIGSIPLQDITGPLAKTRTAPANPQAKTLGRLDWQGTTPVSQKSPNLQGAVSSIMPGKDGQTNPQVVQTGDDSDLKRLRTYEGDIAEILAHKKASVASIAIAEQKRAEQMPTEESSAQAETKPAGNKSGLKFFFIILSIILVGGGAIGGYYLYSQSPLAPLPSKQNNAPAQNTSLVPVNVKTSISIDGMDAISITSRIRTEAARPQETGTIREIILTQNTAGQAKQVGAQDMVAKMDIGAPDILVRSLIPTWMLGIYTDTNGVANVFVVAKTNFFQNAFAGMLQWEQLMADDLKQYLYPATLYGIANIPETAPTTLDVSNPNSTTSQTVSPQVTPYATIRGQFEDHITMNKDVRLFRTTEGKTLFLYSFIDNSTLVIAPNEQTLTEILNRLEKQAFVR